MKRFIVRAMILTLAACGPALAGGTYTFDPVGSAGDWDVAANWLPNRNRVPVGGDHAIIPANKTCIIQALTPAEVDTLEVYGTLSVNDTLTLYGHFGSPGTGTSLIDGQVTMDCDPASPITPTYGRLDFVDHAHTLAGVGKITSSAGNPLIYISNCTVYNGLATSGQGIRGTFWFFGHGTCGLDNGGIIYSTQGTTTMDSTLPLSDSPGAVWGAEGCGTLAFYRSATSLHGDFYSSPTSGTFACYQNIQTCGTYTRNGGGLILATGKTFAYSGFAIGSVACAGNPGANQCDTPVSCNCPYVATSSSNPCNTCQ